MKISIFSFIIYSKSIITLKITRTINLSFSTIRYK